MEANGANKPEHNAIYWGPWWGCSWIFLNGDLTANMVVECTIGEGPDKKKVWLVRPDQQTFTPRDLEKRLTIQHRVSPEEIRQL